MLCAFSLACLACAGVNAQESTRPSAIGAAASGTTPEQISTTRGGFMRFGPVDVTASAEMGVEVNDNVGLSENDRKSDVIFRPRLNLDGQWRASRLNTIRLGLGLGYAKYVNHPNLDTQALLLAPGTQLAFDVYVGEHLRLNIHNRIQITQNPIDESTLSNVQRFARLQNAAGVTAFFRFPDLEFALGYDHFTYHTLSSQFDYLNRSEEQVFGSVRRRVTDAVGIGVEANAALVNYEGDVNNNATTGAVGAFADTTLSEYSKIRFSVGYQNMSFERNGTNQDQSNFGSWYANIAATQRLTQYWSHSVTLGREARLGLSVNYADHVFARYAATWRMNAVMTWGFDAFLEDAKESGGANLNSEHAFRWGAGAALTWKIADRMTLGLRYAFVDKDSDLILRSYYQNSATITLNYEF